MVLTLARCVLGPALKQERPVPESCSVEPSAQFYLQCRVSSHYFSWGSGSAADSFGEHNLDEAEELSSSIFSFLSGSMRPCPVLRIL